MPTHPLDSLLTYHRTNRPKSPQKRIDEDFAQRLTALLKQQTLLSTHRFRVRGYGPPRAGWPTSGPFFYRCLACGYIMPCDDMTYDTCFCGMMSRDIAAGRFGSSLGDQSIEVLEPIPH